MTSIIHRFSDDETTLVFGLRTGGKWAVVPEEAFLLFVQGASPLTGWGPGNVHFAVIVLDNHGRAVNLLPHRYTLDAGGRRLADAPPLGTPEDDAEYARLSERQFYVANWTEQDQERWRALGEKHYLACMPRPEETRALLTENGLVVEADGGAIKFALKYAGM